MLPDGPSVWCYLRTAYSAGARASTSDTSATDEGAHVGRHHPSLVVHRREPPVPPARPHRDRRPSRPTPVAPSRMRADRSRNAELHHFRAANSYGVVVRSRRRGVVTSARASAVANLLGSARSRASPVAEASMSSAASEETAPEFACGVGAGAPSGPQRTRGANSAGRRDREPFSDRASGTANPLVARRPSGRRLNGGASRIILRWSPFQPDARSSRRCGRHSPPRRGST